jgi:ABC-2 type transport system permease protein
VISALLYLHAASARNRVRVQLRRMRAPRYLVALAAGVAYIYWFLVRPANQGGAAAVLGGAWTPLLSALVLAFLATRWWLVGADERALAFTPAELQFLFPAPVTRRGLVHAKLLRAQLLILVNTVIWSVILRGEGAQLSAWLRALALWVLFSTLHLHRLGAALTGASVARHGAAGSRRQALPLVVAVGALGALAWSLWGAKRRLGVAWEFGLTPFLYALGAVLREPVPSAVLAPFRLVVAPTFAMEPAAWGRAMLPALVVLAAHYLWVLRTDSAFEEAALEASERAVLRRDRRRAGLPDDARGAASDDALPRRRSLPLPPLGHPALAILWKNGIAAARAGRIVRQVGVFTVLAGVVLTLAARDERFAELSVLVAGTWGGLLVLAGPLWVRFDLRHDLGRLAVLRAYPLRGRDLVAGEVASSVAALTVIQVALLACIVVASLGTNVVDVTVHDRVALAVAAALALPGVNLATLTVQNAAALLFPAWTRVATGPRGVEAMGQSLVSTALSLAAAAVLLAGPAALALGVFLVTHARLGVWAYTPAAIAGTVAAGAEMVPVFRWLGTVFERTDPTSIGGAG